MKISKWRDGIKHTKCFILISKCSGSNMQPMTLTLSSPTINSSRSGPLSGSTEYSDISPHPDLTSPDSAASLYQRRTQLPPAREDGICHYSPAGPVQKSKTGSFLCWIDLLYAVLEIIFLP